MEETIQNCFKKGGFSCVTTTATVENIVAEKPCDMTQTDSEEWMAVDNNLHVTAKLTEADACDAVTQAGENKLSSDDEADEDQLAVHIPTKGK